MNKVQIKKIIQEKLQIIEVLQSHIQVLRELIDEEVLPHRTEVMSNSNIAQQIEAYRQQVMQSVQSSLPIANGMVTMGGIPDMKKHIEDMKKEMEKKIKGVMEND